MIIDEKGQIINKFQKMSDQYHRLSLLFFELSTSLRIESKRHNSLKEFKDYLKSLNLDYEKIKALSLGLTPLTLNDLRKNKEVVEE